eukprot:TRINITY_DN71455_c0_g1_i1.p2 TRINITY_DN71455_c0_g1~~TRINITY_DN71455_c0_g1_i1.p2  ORF type:complete len:143 (-),score=22.61 TRINITY_DN71455_c0_g1_i1:91-519(-)
MGAALGAVNPVSCQDKRCQENCVREDIEYDDDLVVAEQGESDHEVPTTDLEPPNVTTATAFQPSPPLPQLPPVGGKKPSMERRHRGVQPTAVSTAAVPFVAGNRSQDEFEEWYRRNRKSGRGSTQIMTTKELRKRLDQIPDT